MKRRKQATVQLQINDAVTRAFDALYPRDETTPKHAAEFRRIQQARKARRMERERATFRTSPYIAGVTK